MASMSPSDMELVEREEQRMADLELRQTRYETWLRRKWLVLLRAREQGIPRPYWEQLIARDFGRSWCDKFSDLVPRLASIVLDGSSTQWHVQQAGNIDEAANFRQLVLKVVTVDKDDVFRRIVAYL